MGLGLLGVLGLSEMPGRCLSAFFAGFFFEACLPGVLLRALRRFLTAQNTPPQAAIIPAPTPAPSTTVLAEPGERVATLPSAYTVSIAALRLATHQDHHS